MGCNCITVESTDGKYRRVRKEGIMAVIVNGNRLLLLKRRSFPFIVHPGYWSFVSGSKDKDENYIATAYREIKEETGIEKWQLTVLAKDIDINIIGHKRDIEWHNKLFVFSSTTRTVRLNIENSAYKWVAVGSLAKEERIITDYIREQGMLISLAKRCMSRTINKH